MMPDMPKKALALTMGLVMCDKSRPLISRCGAELGDFSVSSRLRTLSPSTYATLRLVIPYDSSSCRYCAASPARLNVPPSWIILMPLAATMSAVSRSSWRRKPASYVAFFRVHLLLQSKPCYVLAGFDAEILLSPMERCLP